MLASTSVGGWVNSSAPDTQDGGTADPNDFIGWSFVNGTNDPMDDEGHGSFTAGEIGEMTNNSIGGAGLVWNTQIMPVVFLDSSGSGTDTAAAEAIAVFCYQARKQIGAFTAPLGGLDTSVFAGGIGENAAVIRERICAGLDFLGVRLEPAANTRHADTISSADSAVLVRMIRTNEELIVARHSQSILRAQRP